MNFYHLTTKYFPDAKVIVEDRTYEGLKWLSPGEKPKLETFQSLQDEEDRLVRKAGGEVLAREGLMQERQKQARAQAEVDLVPFQKQLGEYFESQRLAFLKLRQEALELQAHLAVKSVALDCWREVSEAQEALNRSAQAYLDETKHYLSWDTHKIPADVLAKREQAHAQIKEGELVYADWQRLREMEMPSKEDMAEALRKGGSHLARIREQCNAVARKYPRPKKAH